jgi:hypothetical protein
MSQRSEEDESIFMQGRVPAASHEKSLQIYFSRIWRVLDRFRSVGIAHQQDQRMTIVISGHAYLPRQARRDVQSKHKLNPSCIMHQSEHIRTT